MTTHRRAWGVRAGVVAALVAGGLLGVAAPAWADDPDVEIINLSKGTLKAGERADLQFTVTNNDDGPTAFAIEVDTFEGLTCEGDCNIPLRAIPPGETATFNARLVAGRLDPGQNRSDEVRVTAQSRANGNDQDTAEQTVTVRGPEEAQTVRRVSGQVFDSTDSDPLADALIVLRDGKGKSFNTTTDDDGQFQFTGSQQRPIAPGRLSIGVSKDGFRTSTKSRTVGAGQSVNAVRFDLVSSTEPTPTASEDPGDEASDEASESGDAGAAPDNASDEDSGSAASWLFIVLGGLLVALGVGAIVLLIVRRKEDASAEAEERGAGRRQPAPAGRGAYAGGADPTRVTTRAGMGGDPTMLRPGLADAPTVMQRAVPADDEFPDPYGAPPMPAGPARGPQPGWGGGEPVGMGQPGMGGRDCYNGAGPGYNGAAPGYNGAAPGYQERYDEPTGRFAGGAGAYDEPPAGGYGGGGGGGYEPRGGDYAPRPDNYGPPGGGYPAADRFGGPPADQPPRGGYDAPEPAGYGEPGGYEPRRAARPEPDGYPPAGGGYEPGGYDQERGYDEPGGGSHSRHAAPPPGGRAERRRLDWLDD